MNISLKSCLQKLYLFSGCSDFGMLYEFLEVEYCGTLMNLDISAVHTNTSHSTYAASCSV